MVTIEERLVRQRILLHDILARENGSDQNRGRHDTGAGLELLQSLPIAHYSTIADTIEAKGLANVLIKPADHEFHTSGSTGAVKKMYFSAVDIERIAEDIVLATHMVGIRQSDAGWNFGGASPLMSGVVMEAGIARIPLKECLSTLLHSDTDLVKCLKEASKAKEIDVAAGAALLYYLIAKTCTQADFLSQVVRGKLRRDYHLPGPLASLVARLYLVGLDRQNLARLAKGVRLGISYAEPLTAYREEIAKAFPNIQMVDVYGSTEIPIIAMQLDPSTDGLSLLVDSFIAELVEPIDIVSSKKAADGKAKGTPWWNWEKGMRGELVLTRDGGCLPLIRYATGDVIEVLDPNYATKVRIDREEAVVRLPLIKVLGRSVDTFDFEVQDESGNFLGNKVYSRHINDALQGAENVKWWELFVVKGDLGRLVFIVIPSKTPEDEKGFHRNLMHRLMHECDDPLHTFQIGADLGRFELRVAPPEAFQLIQDEIDRRVKEGRSLGQMKPKRIRSISSEDLGNELDRHGLK